MEERKSEEPRDESLEEELTQLRHLQLFRLANIGLSGRQSRVDDSRAQKQHATETEPVSRMTPAPPTVPYRSMHYMCRLEPSFVCAKIDHTTRHPSDRPPLVSAEQVPRVMRLIVPNAPTTSIRAADFTSCRLTVGDRGSYFSLSHQAASIYSTLPGRLSKTSARGLGARRKVTGSFNISKCVR